jgi:hypothetical protein
MDVIAATDWTKVTAQATIALAIVTAVLASAAIVAAWYARRGLQAAAADLKATQEASRRPLLVDVAPDESIRSDKARSVSRSSGSIRLTFGDGHSDQIDPRQAYVHLSDRYLYAAVPLRNVGTGLALIDPINVMVLSDSISESMWGEVDRPRVAPNERTRVLCRGTIYLQPDYPWLVTIGVTYYDFLGGQQTITLIDLEQLDPDANWIIRSIKHELPERPPSHERNPGGLAFPA